MTLRPPTSQDRLKKAGYKVTEQEFDFPFFEELAPAELSQVSPTPKDYETATFEYSGSGDVTGTRQRRRRRCSRPTPTPSLERAAARRADFAGSAARSGGRADAARRAATSSSRRENAQAAGYDAVIIFNEGQPGRTDLFVGTLGGPDCHDPGRRAQLRGRPGAATSNTQAGPVTVHVVTSTNSEIRQTTNVIADSKKGDAREDAGRRRAPGLGASRARASTTTAAARRRSSRSPRSSPRRARSRARSCGSRSGARRSRTSSAPTHYVNTLDDDGFGRAVGEPQLRHARLPELRPLRL